MNDRDRLESMRPDYARQGYVQPDPAYPTAKFEGDWDGYDFEIEYETEGGEVILTAVWSGPWNVLDLLTPEQEQSIQHQAEVHAWDL